MPARALIVAVEHYPLARDLDRDLPGTLAAADRFRRWLVDVKGISPAEIYECRDATRQQIVDALQALVNKNLQQGGNNTAELFVFFSGHGFSYEEAAGSAAPGDPEHPPPDVFVAADFESLEHSGNACIKLDALRNRLALALGFGSHFYFADICRNRPPVKKLVIPPLPDFGRVRNKAPYIYGLFSTYRGEIAAAESGFSEILCNGLAGHGHAKRWAGQSAQDLTRMAVTFATLHGYVRGHLKGQEAHPIADGDLDRELLVLAPPPEFTCSVHIDKAPVDEEFTALITGTGTRHRQTLTFKGGDHRLTLKPDDYWIVLTPEQDVVDPVELPADLFGDCSVSFRKAPRGPGPAPVPVGSELATLEVAGAPDTTVRVRNQVTGDQRETPIQFKDQLAPGPYRLSLIEDGRIEVRSEEITLRPGETRVVDLGQRKASPAQDGIVNALPEDARTDRTVTLSESLGWLASKDLALWLAVIGASRIYEDPGLQFRKLHELPFQRFDDVAPNNSPLYVLVGLEDGSAAPVQVGRSNGEKPEWEPSSAVPGFPGISECRIAAPAGGQLLSLKLGDRAPITIATHCLPNRATLIVVVRSLNGDIQFRQYILPLGRLIGALPAVIVDLLPGHGPYDSSKPDRLPMVKLLTQSEELFSSRRTVVPPVGTPESSVWSGLLEAKWLDPIMCMLAAYALLREDQLEPAQALTVVTNLRTYFPGMADTEAIARLANLPYTPPSSPPLFFEGLAAFPEHAGVYPLPESDLEYRGPWVRWRDAVEGPPLLPPVQPPRPGPGPGGIIKTLLTVIAVGTAVYLFWPSGDDSEVATSVEPAEIIQAPVAPGNIVPADTTLEVGETAHLRIEPPTDQDWTWRSESPGVVEVSNQGAITGIGAGSGRITAEHNGAVREANVLVLLPGTATVLPESLAFGVLVAGDTSATQILTMVNPRRTPLTDLTVALSGGSESYTVDNQCGSTVPAMSQCPINVGFAPHSAGFRPGELTISWSPDGATVSRRVSGSAAPPAPVIISGGVRLSGNFDANDVPTECSGPLVWQPVPGDGIRYLVTVAALHKSYAVGVEGGIWTTQRIEVVEVAGTATTPPPMQGLEIFRWTVRARATGAPDGAESEPYFFACRIL